MFFLHHREPQRRLPGRPGRVRRRRWHHERRQGCAHSGRGGAAGEGGLGFAGDCGSDLLCGGLDFFGVVGGKGWVEDEMIWDAWEEDDWSFFW